MDFLKFASNKKILNVVSITWTQPYILTISQIHHNQQLTLKKTNKLHMYKLAICHIHYNHYQQTIHI